MIFRVSVFVFLGIFFTSCFELIEEVNVNEKGGGKFKLTANFSQSAGTLKKLMLVDTAFGIAIPSQGNIEVKIQEAIQALKKIDGISNVSHTQDFSNFMFSLTYDFSNDSTLNKSFIVIAKVFDKNARLPYIPYKIGKNNFIRKHDSGLSENQKNKLISKFSVGMETAKFITIYRFPKEIKSTSNTNCKVSKSKKVVFNQVKLGELILNPKSVSNTISF